MRFRTVVSDGDTWYVAWFEPAHHVVEINAPFFRDRIASMHWSILTPDRCMHWDGIALHFTAGLTRDQAPNADAIEPLWQQYYAKIFNPAPEDGRQAEGDAQTLLAEPARSRADPGPPTFGTYARRNHARPQPSAACVPGRTAVLPGTSGQA